MNRKDIFALCEKHYTYEVEDSWACTTDQTMRLVADVLRRIHSDFVAGDPVPKNVYVRHIEAMRAELEKK